MLVVGWGGTYGAIADGRATRAQRRAASVAHAHLRYLNPMPRNTGDVLRRYRKVLVPELNGGQLRLLLRAAFLVDAVGLNKVQGRPFLVGEIEEKIRAAGSSGLRSGSGLRLTSPHPLRPRQCGVSRSGRRHEAAARIDLATPLPT